MRLYFYMMNIGTVAMLTMSGYSFLEAGVTASAIAVSTFLLSPRVSRMVDSRGQGYVVPRAAALALIGLAMLLATAWFHGPAFLLLLSAFPMGALPNPQALARARWTHLVREKTLSSEGLSIRTVFSYEGVLDDVAFMFGPSGSIALATAIAPVAGMMAGGAVYVLGVVVLLASRATEPEPGLDPQGPRADAGSHASRSVFSTSATIRILFVVMLFVGAFFSNYDASAIALAEELGNPSIASFVLMVTACISMVTGILFGMVRLRMEYRHQLLLCASLAGAAYGCMFLVDSAISLCAVSFMAALFYAPLLITANATCENAVPASRVTEAITWINAGMTCGMALGPVMSGALIDHWGSGAGFAACSAFAVLMPVFTLCCLPLMGKAPNEGPKP